MSDADRLRIIIALAILKLKPKETSVSSFVLSLHSKFPPSGPAPPTADYLWKTYALKLERDYEQLKGRHEAQKMELLLLSDSSVPAEVPSDPPQSSSDNPSKKKAKTKKKGNDVTITAKQPLRFDLQNVLQGLHDQMDTEIPRSSELLTALRAFGKAASDDGNGATLLHATLYTLRIASGVLRSALDPPAMKAANQVSLETLGTILRHVIIGSLGSASMPRTTTSGIELRLTEVDKIFDCLIDSIFGPMIGSFKRLSQAVLLGALDDFSVSNGRSQRHAAREGPHDVDLRPDLLRLFQALVGSLSLVLQFVQRNSENDDCARWLISFATLKASLTLEILREIGVILFPTSPEGSEENTPDTDPKDDGRSDEARVTSRVLRSTVPGSVEFNTRVKRLIGKDTLWYLCSLMHILAGLPTFKDLKSPSGVIAAGRSTSILSFTLEASATKDRTGTELLELLRDAILSALYELVLKCRPTVNQLEKDCVQSADGQCPRTLSDSHPMMERYKVDTLKTRASSTNGEAGRGWGPQSQGQSYSPKDWESEVGDPGGSNRHTLSDIINTSALTGGATCDTDTENCDVAYQGTQDEVIDSSKGPSLVPQPDFGVPASDKVEPLQECLIDEAGYSMLLGVVERYILDPEYKG